MKDMKRGALETPASTAGASIPNRILGSLRDALNAASRESTGEVSGSRNAEEPSARPAALAAGASAPAELRPANAPARLPEAPPLPTQPVSAAEALRLAKTPAPELVSVEDKEPTTRVVRAGPALKPAPATAAPEEVGRTQAVRGKPKVTRTTFHQDPVVGWMVVVGGPGLGAYRPIYEGNNTLGRGKGQRIPIDFGDESISAEEQAYIRYDSVDRSFLFVPNLAKTNIVSINNKKPTGAVPLNAMDVITVGRTQLAFVPFCGEEFDWSELTDLKE
ncbi:MAG TPA: FHA domain-containing protein [Hyphomicrobiaceae bacterium]|jgi:hypothetical protein|nr:FHA domain-containing protein [Hyphomicrobiaceae bacterium]